MRLGVLLGIVLLGLGVWIVWGGGTCKTKKSVVDIGVLKADVREEHQIPRWVGGAVLGAGAAVLVLSLKRKR